MFAPADYLLRLLTAQDEAILWDMLYLALSPESGEVPPPEIVHRPEYERFVEGWGRPGDCGIVALEKAGRALLGAVWLRAQLEKDPESDPRAGFRR
jgi:hypothetical protein